MDWEVVSLRDVLTAGTHNTGYCIAQAFAADGALFDEVMNANVRGTFFCCQEAARLMKDGGGSIVLWAPSGARAAARGWRVTPPEPAAYKKRPLRDRRGRFSLIVQSEKVF